MTVLEEVQKERDYQDRKWGHEFDDKNTINDWGTYAGIYIGNATSMKATKEEQRAGLLKAATLLVAAVQTFDRNGGFAPRHYDKDLIK